MSEETRTCQNCKAAFTIDASDFLFYEKIKVPPPTWCPECRMMRRFIWRNERNLYKAKDAHDGKEIFSCFPPEAGLKVYEHDYWWSDGWDAMEYGRDYDFSRPFFEQLRELIQEVPHASRAVLDLINSDYSDKASYLKNCYLCFNLGQSEDCAYVMSSWDARNSFDLIGGEQVELCYEGVEIENSYRTFFSMYCDQAREVWFSRDCTGCSNCFGCVNLRSKQYHVFNKAYSKEAYFEELAEMKLDTASGLKAAREKVEILWKSMPHKFMHGVQNTDVSGDCIHNSKNVHFSFEVEDAENVKFSRSLSLGVKDSYDHTGWGENSELIYEAMETGLNCRNNRFCMTCWPAMQDTEYSLACGSSSNLFGCVGLKKKSYCIFNKQYSPQDYVKLREKIIRHMHAVPYRDKQGRIYAYGEFFPPEFSPYAYNETLAQDYFPLTKGEALAKGFLWREPEVKEYSNIIKANNLPDSINDTSDTVVNEIIECESCGKPYRIIQPELDFLRANGIALPRICWQCRFTRRLRLGNVPKFYTRNCQCAGRTSDRTVYKNSVAHFHGEEHCPNNFITAFSPKKDKIIYCEQCYNSEIL